MPDGHTTADRRPAIVFFFGGGWNSGTVEQFRPQAEHLAKRGMVAALADYRVRSRHKTSPFACVADGKAAVRWLRANREPAAERAVLRISISSAEALKNKELLGTSDPYCQFTLSGRYTNVVRRTKARGATPLPAQ